VKWGKKKLPQWKGLWEFYSGKSGIGRMVQTSFLFYGGLTTAFLTYFAIHFNAFDFDRRRSLVANCPLSVSARSREASSCTWAYRYLAVGLLAAASMTAFQDLQATEWRDVAIGRFRKSSSYRDKARHLHSCR